MDYKGFDIIDARYNHEDYSLGPTWSKAKHKPVKWLAANTEHKWDGLDSWSQMLTKEITGFTAREDAISTESMLKLNDGKDICMCIYKIFICDLVNDTVSARWLSLGRLKLDSIMYKVSGCTSQWTLCASIRKIRKLMLVQEIILVYWEKRMEHTNKIFAQNSEFLSQMWRCSNN